MDDEEVESLVRFLLEDHDTDEWESTVDRVETFADAGVLTTNRGVVVAFADGSEFQLTIVRSR